MTSKELTLDPMTHDRPTVELPPDDSGPTIEELEQARQDVRDPIGAAIRRAGHRANKQARPSSEEEMGRIAIDQLVRIGYFLEAIAREAEKVRAHLELEHATKYHTIT